MDHALAEQRFDSYEDVNKCLHEWFAEKGEGFYWRGIRKFLERWGKCITSHDSYYEQSIFYHSSEYDVFFRKNSAFYIFTPDT